MGTCIEIRIFVSTRHTLSNWICNPKITSVTQIAKRRITSINCLTVLQKQTASHFRGCVWSISCSRANCAITHVGGCIINTLCTTWVKVWARETFMEVWIKIKPNITCANTNSWNLVCSTTYFACSSNNIN